MVFSFEFPNVLEFISLLQRKGEVLLKIQLQIYRYWISTQLIVHGKVDKILVMVAQVIQCSLCKINHGFHSYFWYYIQWLNPVSETRYLLYLISRSFPFCIHSYLQGAIHVIRLDNLTFTALLCSVFYFCCKFISTPEIVDKHALHND